MNVKAEEFKAKDLELAEFKANPEARSTSALQTRIQHLKGQRDAATAAKKEAVKIAEGGIVESFNNALEQVAVFQPGFVPDVNILTPEYCAVEGKIVELDEKDVIVRIIYPSEDHE